MAKEKCTFEQTFSFSPLPSKKPSFLQDRDTLTLLMKWSMLGRISAQCYSFDQCFYPYSSEKFVQRSQCGIQSEKDGGRSLGASWYVMTPRKPFITDDKPVVSVDVEQVLCTKVSMDLFDPIYSCGILRPSGHVVKCFHDVYPDYDELRQMLQEKDSEHYYVVGNEERGEFLFRLFKHLCFGGELCQYEDTIEPYISTTKQIYKDLISVQKDPETKKISVLSTVLRVCAYRILGQNSQKSMLASILQNATRLQKDILDESGLCYPGRREEEQTFAYLIVDPLKRHVTVFYHCYGVGNFTLSLHER